jgi:hypothetical protein
VLVLTDYYDRDLVLMVPLVVILVLPKGKAPGRGALFAGFVLAGLFGSFSVAATHDYFAWNRARWTALATLTDDARIPPAAIDGGAEFNGIFHYGAPRWWMSGEEEYTVVFALADGYAEVARVPFRRWLPPGEASILVLRRLPAP